MRAITGDPPSSGSGGNWGKTLPVSRRPGGLFVSFWGGRRTAVLAVARTSIPCAVFGFVRGLLFAG
eukprot:5522515-Pyramimonas_sp.AAC.1